MAKKRTKKEEPDFTLEEVQELADDINDQNLFDEIIDLDEAEDATEAAEMVKDIIVEDGECQIFDTDTLKDESFDTLEAMGCPAISEQEEPPEKEKSKKNAKKKAAKKKAASKKSSKNKGSRKKWRNTNSRQGKQFWMSLKMRV